MNLFELSLFTVYIISLPRSPRSQRPAVQPPGVRAGEGAGRPHREDRGRARHRPHRDPQLRQLDRGRHGDVARGDDQAGGHRDQSQEENWCFEQKKAEI